MREGLAPRLYQQAMHELDLPRTYKTIFACGSLGIGGDRRMDLEALRRFYHYLQPGGVLAFDHGLPYGNARLWQYWLHENRSVLPRAWEELPGERRRASDGTEYEQWARVLDLDPLEQVYTFQMRTERRRDGRVIAQEEHILNGCFYFKNELLMMLEQAGFRDIVVYGDHTEVEARAEDTSLVFIARK